MATLVRRYVQVADKAAEGGAGALPSLRACPTAFAGPHTGQGMIAMTSAAVVERLACGTDIAVAFRLAGKWLGTVERAVVSVDAVAGFHIRSELRSSGSSLVCWAGSSQTGSESKLFRRVRATFCTLLV